MQMKKAVLILAHGSRRKEANEQVIVMAKRLAKALSGAKVKAAFMEQAEPSIPDAVNSLVKDGVSEMIVFPYFLVKGVHTTTDIPELLEECAKSAAHKITFKMFDPIGSNPGIFNFIRDLIFEEFISEDFADVHPSKIEDKSFEMIENELEEGAISEEQKFITKRVIHTTGDFDFIRTMRFHEKAIEAGIKAVTEKVPIYTDVSMVSSGINKKHGHEVNCALYEKETEAISKEKGITKTEASFINLGPKLNGAIVAVGNAPTALRRLVLMIRNNEIKPALVVGIPVGFVNAAESKKMLMNTDAPYITCIGRRGGSTIAAAIVNAFIKKVYG
ncbi:MAG: precorrin-8X methylmutase [Spirochaetia bacterium]|nr:precorrin-8X methylmutase [Spirochaetia bacterium]